MVRLWLGPTIAERWKFQAKSMLSWLVRGLVSGSSLGNLAVQFSDQQGLPNCRPAKVGNLGNVNSNEGDFNIKSATQQARPRQWSGAELFVHIEAELAKAGDLE